MIASAHSFFCQRVPVPLTALIAFTAVMARGAGLASAPTPPPPAAVRAALVDPQATVATRKLMAGLVADYGRGTWSGQYYDTNDMSHIHAASGLKPAIVGADFMEYSPSRVAFGSHPGNLTESMIAFSRAGYVITLSWHWNAPSGLLDNHEHPWWRGFYTDASTFDVAAALADTNSVAYAQILRDVDAIAVQLKKFSDVGAPVLWRPLHEADGGWFWWGAKGPEPFKALWRLLYHRLTDHHHLHNLIWIYTGEKPDWYPGNDVVDIIGVDAYPKDPGDTLSAQWQKFQNRFKGKKLVALTEFGGVPDVEHMQASGVWWAYFVSWSGSTKNVPDATVTRVYRAPSVITLDQFSYHFNAGSSNQPAATPENK
jgi:mannan endo-1,4-beta-mannosidase